MERSVSKLMVSAEDCKAKGADLLEIRLDYIVEQLSLNVLKRIAEIKNNTGLPLILTLRPDWEGGKCKKFEERRLDILENGIELGFDYIDLELKIEEKRRDELIAKAKDSGVRTILSHHNFSLTPKWKEIFNQIKQTAKIGADMTKLVYTNNTIDDAQNLLQGCSAAKHLDYTFSVMGVGQYGHITRILGPMVGCEIIYAALAKGKEAYTGQIDISTLKRIWNILELNLN
jgi:3-dehydroquinate dehydratase-1